MNAEQVDKYIRSLRAQWVINFDAPEKKENSLAINANITPDEQRQIDLATEQFKQSVQRVDNQILALYVQAVQNGDYAEAERILENAVESQQVNTLTFALLTIGVILLPLYARQRIQNLLVQFGLHTVFSQTDEGQKALREQAEKGAKSHVKTIAKDIKNNLDDAIDSQITNPDIEAPLKDHFEQLQGKDGKELMKAVKGDQNIYEYARELILKGESRNNVIKKLQENFAEVGKRRANVIAGNEANRIFTLSQFDADKQFLAQNKLTSKAYKRLVSNTGHPEAICAAIIKATAIKPIPFKNDFLPFGKVFTVKGDNGKTYKFKPNYEHLKSGHIHVNCKCRYELLIKQDDGSFLNTYTWKIENDLEFDETKHLRDKDGKFAKKIGIDIEAYVDLGATHKEELQKAQDKLDWAKSGFGDVEEAKGEVETIHTLISKLYRKAFKDNGLTDEDYSKLKRDQLDYSAGGGARGDDGKYLVEPEISKSSKAQQVHTALTQAILAKSYTQINLHRGQHPNFTSEPLGVVSYTDSKAIASSFGTKVVSKMTDVTDILYHYQLDFASVHPSEQEVIVKQ